MQKMNDVVLNKKEFKLTAVERTSHATKYLYLWVKAIVEFTNKWNETDPIRLKAKQSKLILDQKSKELEEKKKELKNINDALIDLQRSLDDK